MEGRGREGREGREGGEREGRGREEPSNKLSISQSR